MDVMMCDECSKVIKIKETHFRGYVYKWSKFWKSSMMSPPKEKHYCEKCMDKVKS